MQLFGLLNRKKNESLNDEMGPLYPQVRAAMLDVQAYARSHGGEIHLVGVSDEGDVSIKFSGACHGCPMAGFTLKYGIEEQLRLLVPGVRRVIQTK